MRILLIPSWYPNRTDQMNGIFVKRHALAISALNPVHVLFVKKDGQLSSSFEIVVEKEGQLKTSIAYYKPSRIPLIGKVCNLLRYFITWNKLLDLQKSEKPDIVHLNVVWPAGLIYIFSKSLKNIPLLITEHWSGYMEEDGQYKRQILNRLITPLVFKKAKAVSVVSSKIKSAIHKLDLHEKVEIISNVVDNEIFRFQSKEKPIAFQFLHVSSFVEREKNIFNMLLAFEQFCVKQPNSSLTLAGNKINFKIYHQEINRLKNKGLVIDYKGELNAKEIALLMQKSHCFLLCSFFETQSCVAIESICCGLPVLSTDSGGVKDVLNQSNAVIFEGFDAASICQGMEKFYARSSSFDSHKIASEAKDLYSPIMIGQKFNALYQSIFFQN